MSSITNDYSLRPIRDDDFSALVAIKEDACRLFGKDYVSRYPLTKEKCERFQGGNFWGVVNHEDRVCGYSGAYPVDDDLFLLNLFVSRAYNRRGLGKLLLQNVFKCAEKARRRAVTLITSASAPWNAPFYSQHGFTLLTAAMPGYLREDLDQEIAVFSPSNPLVQKCPLVVPRVAMERLVT